MNSQAKTKYKINPLLIIGSAFKEWYGHFNSYTKIVLAVALPVAILTILQTDGSTGDFGLTMAFAWSFTIISLIINAHNRNSLLNNKLTNIYSLASARFLQYLGVTIVIIACAAPAIVGWLAILSVLSLQSSFAPIVFVVSSFAIILSFHLLARFSLAQVFTVGDGQTVYNSLQLSSKSTKRNRLRIFIGISLLIIVVVLIANGIQILLSLNRSLNENVIINNLVYVLEATIFLPLIYIYLVKIKEALSG